MAKALKSIPVFVLLAVGLSGCFDLTQSVSLNRDGSGTYAMTIAAEGPIGEAMKKDNKSDDMHFGHNPNLKSRTRTAIVDGKVTKTGEVDFQKLSDLDLSNETVAVKVKGHDLFGLGSTHAIFRRSFLVGNEMRDRNQKADDDAQGKAILASIFGNHAYVFRVRLPGSIDWIAPVYANGLEVKPQVISDASGHTIIWRMPLLTMIESKALHFSVGFSAYGALSDSETTLEKKGIQQVE